MNRAALAAMIACQVALHACAQGMRLAAPLNALGRGQGALWVGVTLSMFALGPALLALPAGRLADRRGYHVPLRLAAACALAGTLLAAWVQSSSSLCLAAALCGIGSGVGMIALQRSAGHLAVTPAERLRVFSLVALAPALAGLIGPLLAGALIDFAGFAPAFLALAVLPVLALWMAQAVPHEMPRSRARQNVPGGRASSLLRLPLLRQLLFVSWLVSVGWDLHGFALPLLGAERALPATALGWILAAYAGASMAVRVLIPVLAHRLPHGALLAASLALAAAVFALYPLQHGADGMALCAAALGLAFGAVQPAIMATLHAVTPSDRHGAALGLRALTLHASMAVMPLAFGLTGGGATPLFWIMAAALTLGVVSALRLMNATPSSHQQQPAH